MLTHFPTGAFFVGSVFMFCVFTGACDNLPPSRKRWCPYIKGTLLPKSDARRQGAGNDCLGADWQEIPRLQAALYHHFFQRRSALAFVWQITSARAGGRSVYIRAH